MENQVDELNLDLYHKEYQGIYSFPYQLQTPKIQPYLLNQYGDQALQMPQSLKYLHQIFPHNQTMETRQQEFKRFIGIKYLFGLQEKSQNDFLEEINTQIFNVSFFQNPNLIDLTKLFEDQENNSQQIQYKKLLDELTKRLSQIQNKAFSGISIHKTIGKAFYQHFTSYRSIQKQSSFVQSFQASFQKFLQQTSKIKKQGQNLILMIYQFWMRMFREFVREIWRHSQKYSLHIFSKNKYFETSNDYQSNRSSTSSSQQEQKIDKDRRKPWSKCEIQILQKIISSNAVFNNIRLQKLAQELGRSSTSISSKIQKIVKSRKSKIQQDLQQNISIDKKIELILKLHPEGLSKEDVIKRMNEMYDMGLEDNWKKSVCQILSSKKNIIKVKGSFRLANAQNYSLMNLSQTLKDKLIAILLYCQDYESDLKGLSQKYLQTFGKQENMNEKDKQKIKILQTNISKCLNRYDVFQRTNEKLIYKLSQNKNEVIEDLMDLQEYID